MEFNRLTVFKDNPNFVSTFTFYSRLLVLESAWTHRLLFWPPSPVYQFLNLLPPVYFDPPHLIIFKNAEAPPPLYFDPSIYFEPESTC